MADDPIGHVDVTVLDHDAGGTVAPKGVERTHALAGEGTLDSRTAKGAGHGAVELSPAAEEHRPLRRSEVGDDAGEQLIALLPVAAGDVKRQMRAVAPLGAAVERDVGALGCKSTLLDRHLVWSVSIDQFGGDRQVRRQCERRKRTPLGASVAGVGRCCGHRRHPRRRCDDQMSFAAMLRKIAGRPLENIGERAGAGEAESAQLFEVTQLRDVDIRQCRVEMVSWRSRRSERLDVVSELGVATEKLRAGVPDFERLPRPSQRPI